MNYITNQTDQVIAADDSLLRLLNVENIEELTRQIILGDICFTTLPKQSISISTESQTFTFDSHTSVLSSMVGSLNLITLEDPVTEDTSVFIDSEESLEEADNTKEAEMVPNDALTFIKEEETPTTLINPEEPALSYDDDVLFDLTIPQVHEDTIDEISIPQTEDTEKSKDNIIPSETLEIKDEPKDALDDLIIPQVPEETIDEIVMDEIFIPQTEDLEKKDEIPSLDTTPIIINVKEVSSSIGISEEDYTLFLNEYIDTAITLEDDLKSNEEEKRSSAIASLSQLSSVLQLPLVNELMTEISLKTPQEQEKELESFYAILARFVASHEPEEQVLQKSGEVQEIEETHDIQEELLLEKEAPLQEVEPSLDHKDFGSINLDDVQPIHFDFRMEEAADDLSLPVELIEEFVHDFIEQAHTETKKMLEAYEKGDLDTIQKVGHMLKGASSNLRINALSDTLYDIQFCEDITKMQELIKRYWGHFLSFEQQIDILTK